MPAAAVIPAPIAYIKVVAVKKLVVGFLLRVTGPPSGVYQCCPEHLSSCARTSMYVACSRPFTLRKLECFKQAYALNTLAWNNKVGLRFYFVGF